MVKSQFHRRGNLAFSSRLFEVIDGDGAATPTGGSCLETRTFDLQRSRRSTVAAVVVRALQPYAAPGQTVTLATEIMTELRIDSLAAMNALMEIEDLFDVSIPLNRLALVRTVDDLISLVLSKFGTH